VAGRGNSPCDRRRRRLARRDSRDFGGDGFARRPRRRARAHCGCIRIDLLAFLGTEQLPLGAQVVFDGRVAAVAWFGSLLVGIALAVPSSGSTCAGTSPWPSNRNPAAGPLATPRNACARDSSSRKSPSPSFFWRRQSAGRQSAAGARRFTGLPARKRPFRPAFPARHPLSNKPDRLAFAERLLGELRAQPGVAAATISTSAPFIRSADVDRSVVTVEGVVAKPGDSLRAHTWSGIVGDYGTAFGIPLRAGRWLEASDQLSQQRVCVVDEAFARRYWPRATPSATGSRRTPPSRTTRPLPSSGSSEP